LLLYVLRTILTCLTRLPYWSLNAILVPIPSRIRAALGSTRAEILDQLLHHAATADELAQTLGIATSAVRSQLAFLERDGFIERNTRHRPARGKPAHEYRIAPTAQAELSTAYAPLAASLLGVLRDRIPHRDLVSLLRSVGRRLAFRRPAPNAPFAERVAAAARALDELGGAYELTPTPDRIILSSTICPLASVTAEHHECCHALAEFAGEVAAAPARTRCVHHGRPRCIFEIMGEQAAPDASGHSGE